MGEATTSLDAAYRALAWCGYAGLAGAFAVLLLWPQGTRQRRLALVALAGVSLLVLATAGWLLLRLVLQDGVPRSEGTSALVRLAVLAAVAGFFTDLLDGPTRGRRRTATAVLLAALTATMLAGAAGASSGQVGSSLAGNAYVAMAALVLGGCVVLVAVVRPGDARAHLPLLREQTERCARPALGLTALAGAVHAVAAERSPLGVPAPQAVLEVILLLACVGAVVATRRLVGEPPDDSSGDRGPAPRSPSTFPPVASAQVPADPDAGRCDRAAEDRRPAAGVHGGPRPPRAQVRARYVAGIGRLPLPDTAGAPPVRRTVRVAGSLEPLVVELPGTRAASGR